MSDENNDIELAEDEDTEEGAAVEAAEPAEGHAVLENAIVVAPLHDDEEEGEIVELEGLPMQGLYGLPYELDAENWEDGSDEEQMESNDSSNHESSSSDSSTSEDEGREHYELSLPTRHEYLGLTQEVRGRTVVEDNEYVRIPLLLHSTLMNIVLMPNQTLPLSISHPLHRSMLMRVIEKNKLIGIVHKEIPQGGSQIVQFGTTAEIYEYDSSDSVTLSIKAKGRQRFRVIDIHREVTGCVEAKVKILPEIKMPDPFHMVRSKSLQRMNLPKHCAEYGQSLQLRDVRSLRSPREWRARKRCAMLTPWPSWVYDQYDDTQLALRLVNEITNSFNLKQDKVMIPRDPQELSHWASINLPLNDAHKLALLSLNTPTQRLRYILSIATHFMKSKILCCNFCNRTIAHTSNIFSMSLEGPQGTFVNPGGYVHEMFTITKASGVVLRGRASNKHSWFPGYAWTIANCNSCNSHVGWNFKSGKEKLKPSNFYGITRKSVKIKFVEANESDPFKYVM